MCRLLGVGLLGVAAGCGQTQSQRYAVAPSRPRGVEVVHSGQATPMAQRPIAPAYGTPVAHEEELTAEGMVITADHQVAEGSEDETVIPVAASQSAPMAAVPIAPVPMVPAAPAQASQSEWAPVVSHVVPSRGNSFNVGEPVPSRRAVVDITAAPCFAKAEDYSWLQGQVEYSRLSKSWRLRYASVDEIDRYGGSVTLTGDSVLDNLKDGQYIRVTGYLPNADSRSIAPTFHVESIEQVQKQ
jgi:hypothetical protein